MKKNNYKRRAFIIYCLLAFLIVCNLILAGYYNASIKTYGKQALFISNQLLQLSHLLEKQEIFLGDYNRLKAASNRDKLVQNKQELTLFLSEKLLNDMQLTFLELQEQATFDSLRSALITIETANNIIIRQQQNDRIKQEAISIAFDQIQKHLPSGMKKARHLKDQVLLHFKSKTLSHTKLIWVFYVMAATSFVSFFVMVIFVDVRQRHMLQTQYKRSRSLVFQLTQNLNDQKKISTFTINELDSLKKHQVLVEQSLTQAQTKLKKNQESADNFSYLITHKLKEPIQGILNLTNWLEEDLEDHTPPETKEHILLLKSRVNRLTNLIDNISQYAQKTKKVLKKEKVYLNQSISKIINTLDFDDVEFEIEKDLPIVITQKFELETILRELIFNAIIHNNKSKKVIHVSCETAVDQVTISVSDNGLSIPNGEIEHVFTPFYTTKSTERAGLGLSIVKKILLDKNMEITVSSNNQNGNTFSFSWPIT